MRPSPSRLIEVKVQPRAKRREVVPDDSGGLTVRVLSAPERGRANDEVRELLADHFGVPISRVRIVRGETSRHKLVSIES